MKFSTPFVALFASTGVAKASKALRPVAIPVTPFADPTLAMKPDFEDALRFRASASKELLGQVDSSLVETSLTPHSRLLENTEPLVESWFQLGQDIDGEARFDQSGRSVSLSSDGKTVAIGAPDNDGNGDSSGHVRIFTSSAPTFSALLTMILILGTFVFGLIM